jgi:hypothetical protein
LQPSAAEVRHLLGQLRELDGIDVLVACNLIELLADPLEQVVIGVDV